ncbi:MAG: DNA primase [Sphingobacteriia bacterium 35-40-8]|nr:MAG: DNA primase [Sphingobacteriia bacterium 35-40-8]
MTDTDRARDALYSIPADLPRDDWVKAGMAAHAAGIDFDAFNDWSAGAGNYDARAARDTWHSFKPGKGVGAGTLFKLAADNGWRMGEAKPQRQAPAQTRPVEPPRQPAPGMSPADVWSRCEAATVQHPYIVAKQAAGVPLDGLRVVPAGDALRIGGERMAGALVVPVIRADGCISSLQFIAPPDVAERLKAKGKPGKLNLPGCPVQGSFTVGELLPGGVAYIVEGIGAAWSCWQATGAAAVVCFGSGRMRAVAAELRQQDPSARLVLVPDTGKEEQAQAIAKEVNALVVTMPPGWPQNSDVNDLAQREGNDALAALLESATAPPQPEPRYKLLGADDLRNLPALAWRVRGVLPAVGLAGLYGPSASGKSFLALDMAAAIAEGRRWFDCRVEAAPVVYAALEGEGGFKLRVAAWEAHTGRVLPDGLAMVLQSFKLTEPQDIADLAAVGAAKLLQSLINGLVVLVHHTGKDATKGLRGHSSLFAALDAAVEVSRDGERREWKVAKSKDGQDGDAQPFKLQIETLGTDDYGDAVTSCVVVRDNAAQDVRAVKLPQGGNQRLVLDALRPMFKDGATGKPGSPPLVRCIELEAAVIAGAGRLPCQTDRRATRTREAITGLVSRGVMGLNEGWLWLN